MADEIGDPMREETMSTRDHGEPDGYSTLAGGTATDIVATGPTAERRSPRRVLPLVPLRGNVPMPGMPMPISVGRPVSVAAVKAAQSGETSSCWPCRSIRASTIPAPITCTPSA